MPFNPKVLQIYQIGDESTAGTAVSADTKLLSYTGDADPEIPTEDIESSGVKGLTGVVVAKERTIISIKGQAAFDDMLFLLAGHLEAPTITTPGGATNTRLWTFQPNPTDTDTLKAFTFEIGNSINAYRCAGVRFDDMEMIYTPGKTVEFSAKGIGKEIETGITMTGSPTDVVLRTMSPRKVDVYFGTTLASITSSQIKPMRASWKIANRFNAIDTLDSAEVSWEDIVELALKPTAQFTANLNSAANTWLSALQAGTTYYIQFLVTGDTIEGAHKYQNQITIPVKLDKIRYQDMDGVKVAVVDLKGIYDSTAGYIIDAQCKTARTAI